MLLKPRTIGEGRRGRPGSVPLVVDNLNEGTQAIALNQVGAGQWQATFPFPSAAVFVGQSAVTLELAAARADGSTASISIPVSLAGP